MADAPSRPPWGAPQQQYAQQYAPQRQYAPQPQGRPMGRPPERQLSFFGKLAVTVGLGVLGYYLLDGHSHTCEACGKRWRHLGAFNFGEVPAHTCAVCGTVQFWKDGFKHVFPDSAQRTAPSAPSGSFLAGLQEIRDFARHAIPSIAPADPPQPSPANPPQQPPPPSGIPR